MGPEIITLIGEFPFLLGPLERSYSVIEIAERNILLRVRDVDKLMVRPSHFHFQLIHLFRCVLISL